MQKTIELPDFNMGLYQARNQKGQGVQPPCVT